MMAGSHVAFGAAAWMLAAPHFGQVALAPVGLGLAVAGSLLPDIDHPKSWAGRRLRPVSTLIATVFGHRGVTHSLLALVGCWAALRYGTGVPRAWVAPVVVGYLSHLLADLLTPGGLRLAWPLRGTWALPLCRSGSPFEPLVVALAMSLAWCALPERPDPHAALQRVGLRLERGTQALPLPPPAPPALRQKLAAQRGTGRGG